MPLPTFCRRFKTRSFLWRLRTANNPTRRLCDCSRQQPPLTVPGYNLHCWDLTMKSSFRRHHPALTERPQLCPSSGTFHGPASAGLQGTTAAAALAVSRLPGPSPLLLCVPAVFSLAPTPQPYSSPGLRFTGGQGRSHVTTKAQPSLRFGSSPPARSPARFLGSRTQRKLSPFLCVQDPNISPVRHSHTSLQAQGNTAPGLIRTSRPAEGSCKTF